MSEYRIRLEAFEGPLDLLLHLIEKNKIDIYDIPITVITEQYLDYLEQFKEFNLDVASEFIVMAATLLQIKSRILLPKVKPTVQETVEEEVDPRQELVERLVEYRKYKEASEMLDQMAHEQSRLFFRPPQKLDFHYAPLESMDIGVLCAAFRMLMAAHSETAAIVAKEKFSVKDKMNDILALVGRCKGIWFAHIFTSGSSKLEFIVTFLALLELIKLKKIIIEQKYSFAPIYLSRRE